MLLTCMDNTEWFLLFGGSFLFIICSSALLHLIKTCVIFYAVFMYVCSRHCNFFIN